MTTSLLQPLYWLELWVEVLLSEVVAFHAVSCTVKLRKFYPEFRLQILSLEINISDIKMTMKKRSRIIYAPSEFC